MYFLSSEVGPFTPFELVTKKYVFYVILYFLLSLFLMNVDDLFMTFDEFYVPTWLERWPRPLRVIPDLSPPGNLGEIGK